MEKIIDKALRDSIKVKEEFIKEGKNSLMLFAERIAAAFTGDRKLMICGNGGSAADAQHIAAEFVNRFILERPPLPAIALTTDTSILTAVSNDYDYDHVFSRQLAGLAGPGDGLVAISTSGNSGNALAALDLAREMGLKSVALCGRDGGRMKGRADHVLVVPSDNTARIQEAHSLMLHYFAAVVESTNADKVIS